MTKPENRRPGRIAHVCKYASEFSGRVAGCGGGVVAGWRGAELGLAHGDLWRARGLVTGWFRWSCPEVF